MKVVCINNNAMNPIEQMNVLPLISQSAHSKMQHITSM
jgi:hypothetical protein